MAKAVVAIALLAMMAVAFAAETVELTQQPRGVVAGTPDKKTDLDTASSFFGGYGLGFGGLYGGWGGWGGWGIPYGYGWGFRGYGWPGGFGYGGYGGFYG